MLSNIKSKFLNVSQKVKFLQNEKPKESSVNFEAGSEILDYFKNHWEMLHENNERNAKKAAQVAENIEEIYKNFNRKKSDFETITDIFTNSNLITNVNQLDKRLNDLFQTCDNVEKGLIILEDVINEIEFENLKLQHEFHLNKYEEKRKENHKQLEKKLEIKKKEHLALQEIEQQKVMEERQKVFQEAFKTDIELFKTLGEIPKVELNRKQPSALLEEIQIDFDEKELDQFFDEF